MSNGVIHALIAAAGGVGSAIAVAVITHLVATYRALPRVRVGAELETLLTNSQCPICGEHCEQNSGETT